MNKLYLIYSLIINSIALIFMIIDKNAAIKKKPRISEISFFALSFLGGFIGIALGMVFSKHKTRKLSFQFKVFLGFGVHIALLYLIANSL